MPPAAFKSQPSRHHLPPRRYQTTATASVILRPLHCQHRPITAANEDGTSYSNGKQVTAGRHVTTESPVGNCLALIASRYSSPSPSTGKIHYHFYGQLPEIAPGCFQIAAVQASPPPPPPYRSARDVSRLHQLTAAAGKDQFRREATLYHRPLHPTPGLSCQNTPSPARFGTTPDALPTHHSDGHINGSNPVVTSHQQANRLLPLSPYS